MGYTLNQFKKLSTPIDKIHTELWEKDTRQLPQPFTPDVDRLTEEELSKTAFKIIPEKGTPFFVDNALTGIINENNCGKYIKSCFLSGYFTDLKHTDYRRYIFRWDKEARHLGKHNTYVRADYLRISIGAQNKAHRDSGVVTIRANGSIEGSNKRYNSYITQSLPYLVQLQQGPGAVGPLLDILDATPIKDHSLVQGVESRYVDLHHILVVNGISSDKTVEPTILLGKSEFINLKHEDIIEILKCIVLAPGLHKEIHSYCGNSSGFSDWLKLFNDQKIKMLPYYLLNDQNYINTINWLDNVCTNFDKNKCTSYNKFIASIS